MNDFISEQELEHLSEQQLQERFSQIFNTIARMQKGIEECTKMIISLNKIRNAINFRR